jgi:hypothetical protein
MPSSLSPMYHSETLRSFFKTATTSTSLTLTLAAYQRVAACGLLASHLTSIELSTALEISIPYLLDKEFLRVLFITGIGALLPSQHCVLQIYDLVSFQVLTYTYFTSIVFFLTIIDIPCNIFSPPPLFYIYFYLFLSSFNYLVAH